MDKNAVEAWMLEHYQRNPRVSEMAQTFGYEQCYFQRMFKSAFGVSAKQYLLNLRLDEAYRLIEQTGYSSHWVWMKLGFADRSKFLFQYKRRFGMTPVQHRKRVHGIEVKS